MSDAQHPLAAHLVSGRYGATSTDPVRIAAPRRDLVQISARKGQIDAMKAGLKAAFGVELGGPGQAASGGGVTALPIQPGAWMLVSEPRGEAVFAAAVKAAVGSSGSVVDQTHGRCLLSLSGEKASEVLSRLSRIDLHPMSFGVGRVAMTPLAEMSCQLHHAGPANHYEMIVFSTFADSFFHSLVTAAATNGYETV